MRVSELYTSNLTGSHWINFLPEDLFLLKAPRILIICYYYLQRQDVLELQLNSDNRKFRRKIRIYNSNTPLTTIMHADYRWSLWVQTCVKTGLN